MTYELAKQLKDAGFSGSEDWSDTGKEFMVGAISQNVPTLSELITACGDEFYSLVYATDKDWRCFSETDQWNRVATSTGKTPEETVAKLWLELNKKE